MAQSDTNGDGIVTYLVPVVVSPHIGSVRGANGSSWKSEVWVHNTTGVAVVDLQNAGRGQCVPIIGCGPAEFPAESLSLAQGSIGTNQSAALFNFAPDAAGLQFSVRLLELSKRAQPTGVDIPAIPEKDFLKSPVSLLAVPTGNTIRSALRIYDPRIRADSAVRVDFLADDGSIVATRTLRPSDAYGRRQFLPPYLYPTVATILDLTLELPVLATLPRFHVRVTPLVEGMEYYAMVSVTDNESQHVLLITPN